MNFSKINKSIMNDMNEEGSRSLMSIDNLEANIFFRTGQIEAPSLMPIKIGRGAFQRRKQENSGL